MSGIDRRGALKVLGAAGLLAAAQACRRPEPLLSPACEQVPAETAGPFPADGSNGPNVLTDPAAIRNDIRKSFGAFTGTAPGIPLRVRLKIEDRKDCLPIVGAAVYLWHCDRDGKYSVYDVADQNWLRGIQQTDRNGDVSFRTIFPGAYAGRWPHLHFEVFDSLAKLRASKERRTSQLALPEDACRAVYATAGYERSLANLGQSTLDGDMVFSDGHDLQLPTMSGSVANGYSALLNVAV